MKIDRMKINMLCKMNDERMWSTVKFFASANGIDLSGKRVTQRDIENCRRMLLSLTDADIKRANELISIYKYGR
ncbi:MAG: hypothetical protein IKN38_06400 [Clostridia bacterium]|nr:hypothetical protein [Clostridia bacterium]